MLRTRLLWFTLGAATSAAAMTHFVAKDLLFDRRSLSAQLKEKFEALEARVSNLEGVPSKNPNSLQVNDPVLGSFSAQAKDVGGSVNDDYTWIFYGVYGQGNAEGNLLLWTEWKEGRIELKLLLYGSCWNSSRAVHVSPANLKNSHIRVKYLAQFLVG
ncbi:hypothetical protein RJ639_046745 [Escallonia herrerae]|uniref:Uncharacterized protein n=1 Tax=Escallonia herrerae TaxID=1293975 RepID=A0AA89AZ13_9ASTE|nr:hypothetical protein RJ639_046745 [Escallonia herrerae]